MGLPKPLEQLDAGLVVGKVVIAAILPQLGPRKIHLDWDSAAGCRKTVSVVTDSRSKLLQWRVIARFRR